MLRTARGLGDEGRATIIGDDRPASQLAAVLANAYLSTAITACDVYIPSHCHLTPEVIPAALAVAEAEHASGPAFLAAGYAGLEWPAACCAPSATPSSGGEAGTPPA